MKAQNVILIVDDSAVSRMQLRHILEPEYLVVEAVNGRQALARLADLKQGVTAMLLDLVMPELDGFGVLRALSDGGNTYDVPVLVLTSSSKTEDEQQALELGAAEFISKPYRPEIVRMRLQNIIRLRENRITISSAESDVLTGLYTRDTFYRRLRQLFDEVPSTGYALAAVDIDRFKLINDLFGVNEGDKLLRHMAQQLRRLVAEQSGVCCRISGGHFAFVCEGEARLQTVIDRLRRDLQDYPLSVQVLLRFGVFRVDDLDLEISTMCDRAMLALETVRGRYDSFCAYYDGSIRDRLLYEQQIENDMRAALELEQYVVYYQPKVDLWTGRIVGAEALVRWEHPRRGLLQPDAFIPLFERNGFITELDLYVWKRVCRDMAALLGERLNMVPVSVNLSRADVYDPHLVEKLLQTVQAHDLQPQMLNLEITETAYTQNPHQLVEVVERLKKAGFHIEMDDFGSGYSSLNMLSELPIDTLKLDMRFMQNKMTEKRNEILNFVVSLARWLGLVVIAEGVETEEQAQFLRSLNCNMAQGYLYSQPICLSDFRSRLLENEGVASPVDQVFAGTVELSDLWSPTSAFNNIFNSFIGILTIYEFSGDALTFIRANEKFYELSGAGGVNLAGQGRDVLPWVAPEDRQPLLEKLRAAWQDGREFATDVRWRTLEDQAQYHWLHMRFKLINRAEHRAVFLSSQEDVTKSKLLEQHLLEAAQHDSMTGLLNRVAFENAVTRELEEQSRRGGNGAFIILDLDNFKQVNDTGGHQQGDFVLRQVAQFLKEAIRAEDFMARFGGDEFAVYMRNIPSSHVAMDRTQSICDRVLRLGAQQQVSCSAGIALAPEHGTQFGQLYRQADAALYQAKRRGKNQYVLADGKLSEADAPGAVPST